MPSDSDALPEHPGAAHPGSDRPCAQLEPPELWGGLECTVNRVQDTYFSQLERNGHADRLGDIERFASLGLRALRYPVLWERVAPAGLAAADWRWTDERLHTLRTLGVAPIAGLVHHGSGPAHTSLVDPAFAEQLALYARAVASRYPWLDRYTPVNEPLTTARFSGLYGLWYPHGRDDRLFLQALLNQCRGVVLSMQEIRRINPAAQLVQTDDLGRTHATPGMQGLADFYNERRWLGWDLLCGRVDERHPLWRYLIDSGIAAADALWFRDHPCPPDVIGINYYITSERWLDERVHAYPPWYHGHYSGVPHADVEAPRLAPSPAVGMAALLMETWQRYGLPIAITEAHIDAPREHQLHWLLDLWDAAHEARRDGADIRAVTPWALLGSYDWNCLVTACRGHYEPGAFDVRSPQPRPTAVATLMRELASARPLSHPVLQGRRGQRPLPPQRHAGPLIVVPSAHTQPMAPTFTAPSRAPDADVQPILVIGANGTLGSAFARLCSERRLTHRVLTRGELNMADPRSVQRAILQHQPWAIVNAGGFVRIDDAECEGDACWRDNALGPAVLAAACAVHDIALLGFSSDLVFDGRQRRPYVESDAVAPVNVYGRSKAAAERHQLDVHPRSLVVRTSAFFGPWDRQNFLHAALGTLARGEPFMAANDVIITATFVPDLVHACLDLLVDGECGLWHLAQPQALSWAALAQRACTLAGVDTSQLQPVPARQLGWVAPRPAYSALGSERGQLLPPLDDALRRWLDWDGGVPGPGRRSQAAALALDA
jgi:dTDP-4-dehydrorhamnose reductase